MDRKQHIRVYIRFLKFEIKERLIDLMLIAVPTFIATGLVVSSVAIWMSIWGLL